MARPFVATTRWVRTTPDFDLKSYDRAHEIRYGSGVVVPASASPEFRGQADRTNPEEELVGALSSCHMLTFLAYAARKGLVVDAYEDEAEGQLGKNERGKTAVTQVVLRPRVQFASAVSPEDLAHLHAAAHEDCFIANSVRTDVRVEPRETEGP